MNPVDLSVTFCGVKCVNPFFLSSSPVSNSAEMCARAFEAGWGGVAYKTIVTDRIPIIHPSPRMHGYHYGSKRLMGLQNIEQTSDRGLKANLLDIAWLKKHYPDRVVLASIMGFSNDESYDLAKACTDAGADMLELNFSCPHMTVEGSGHKVGKAMELVKKFTETCRRATELPLVAKLTPNITDMNVPAMFAKEGGADAIAAINTVSGLTEIGRFDLVPRQAVFGKGASSGYSGPAVKPIGLRFISDMAPNPDLKLPLSGIGGIETWVDCLEYILVGASTVQVTCSGLLSVNLGHGHPYVIDAMKKQMEKLCYVGTGFATEPRARLAKMIADVTPGDLDYVFFTNGGAESNENAIKAVRWFTGRQKIYSAWRSYHGATAGSITLTGDPRRWVCEPGIPGMMKYFGPYCYRCPWGYEDEESCGLRCLEMLKEQVMLDGPKTIAAFFIEPIVGTNGIINPPKAYVQGLRQLCDENGILLVADEVMGAWGRAGRWFSIDHFGVVPDIITTAKGMTSSYVQLGAMVWNRKLQEHLSERPFMSGLTSAGHALACACGVANLEIYHRDNIVAESAAKGEYLLNRLKELKERHPSVGDVRAAGLWACIELVSDQKTKAPMAGFADSGGNVTGEITRRLMEDGVYIYAKWDFLFLAPPLVISREEIDRALAAIDRALEFTDANVRH